MRRKSGQMVPNRRQGFETAHGVLDDVSGVDQDPIDENVKSRIVVHEEDFVEGILQKVGRYVFDEFSYAPRNGNAKIRCIARNAFYFAAGNGGKRSFLVGGGGDLTIHEQINRKAIGRKSRSRRIRNRHSGHRKFLPVLRSRRIRMEHTLCLPNRGKGNEESDAIIAKVRFIHPSQPLARMEQNTSIYTICS